MDLVRADTLFGGCEQVRGLEPLMELNVAPLENGANRDRKFALAGAAAPQASATALDQRNPIKAATTRAKRPLWPDNRLQPGDCSRFIVKMRRGKNAHTYPRIPLTRNIESAIYLSSI